MYTCVHDKYPLCLPELKETWISRQIFEKIIKYQIAWKFVLLEPICYMWAGGRTDGQEEDKSRFSQFCERP